VGTDTGGDPDAPLSDASVDPLSDASVDDSAVTELDSAIADSSDVTDTAPALDTGTDAVADTSAPDASDSGPIDSGSVTDTKPTETAAVDTGSDAGWTGSAHVHVYISNTCAVSTSPTSFDVPAGKTLKLSWHNHSADYRADLWGSYGGGYLMLEKGATWNEPYEHCFIESTHTEYMDVTPEGSPSACGKVRLTISCHAP
jgi:hypothetical protein